MKILGLNGWPGVESHDASAALFADSKLIAAVEQERLSRVKHAYRQAPVEAARFCLDYAGLQLDEVDYITYGWSKGLENTPSHEKAADWIIKSDQYTAELLPRKCFGFGHPPPIYYVKHHICHIGAAFFESGFEDAACLVIDGQGEDESITLAEVSAQGLKIIRQYELEKSLGLFYEAACKYSGFGYDVPGKFMGLAAFGKYRPLQPIRYDSDTGQLNTVIQEQSGDVRQRWIHYFTQSCYPYRMGSPETVMYYQDFAATVQKVMERVILSLLAYLRSQSDSENLVIGGGVALNCAANSAVWESQIYKNIYIHPASNDAGCSIGSIYELCRALEIQINPPTGNPNPGPYLGPQYDDEQIQACLDDSLLDAVTMDEDHLIDKVSDDLMQDKIIAWYQGRSEMGPRALGHRSILGNPGQRHNLYRINEIKSRELWRPLAPSVIEEHFHEIFEACSGTLSQYMLTTAKVREKWLKRIPAVVHIDGTTRPQRVGRQLGRYHALIKRFYEKSGVPLVINTSFNLHGQPIVNSPFDAVDVFRNSKDINVLVLGNKYIARDL